MQLACNASSQVDTREPQDKLLGQLTTIQINKNEMKKN